MRRATPLVPLLLTVALAACGGQSNPSAPDQAIQGGGPTLASADVDQVLEAEESVLTVCRLVADQEGSDLPVAEAVRILAGVYQGSGGEATMTAGSANVTRNMETVVEENVERLRSCGRPAEAAALERVLG